MECSTASVGCGSREILICAHVSHFSFLLCLAFGSALMSCISLFDLRSCLALNVTHTDVVGFFLRRVRGRGASRLTSRRCIYGSAWRDVNPRCSNLDGHTRRRGISHISWASFHHPLLYGGPCCECGSFVHLLD